MRVATTPCRPGALAIFDTVEMGCRAITAVAAYHSGIARESGE